MISGTITHDFRGLPIDLEYETEGETLQERLDNMEFDARVTLGDGKRYDLWGFMTGPDEDKASDLVYAEIRKQWHEGRRG